MIPTSTPDPVVVMNGVEARARLSRGSSPSAIARMVAGALAGRHPGGGTLLDVGCGTENLSRLFPRGLSDNVLLIARKPTE
ncbi:MAG TPA: hypothetical protein VFG68_11375 [Fimbriiglobus sp.]|nr:hypothetical protein [Fimbriiglobus sp.]